MISLSAAGFAANRTDWYAFLQRARLAPPSAAALRDLQDRAILVTGAGGSIGAALSLRLAALQPRRLILLDASEQALYRLQAQLVAVPGNPHITTVLGSVNDVALLDELFEAEPPDLVFHAAAHKHAPLLEAQPLAAIATNTLGTLALCERFRAQRSGRLVLLSTDKAVEPTNILGATKRIAEQITLACGGIAVRLANVLGSEGSVVESFLQQIHQGGPLTITHPEADRFFLTREETIDLLLAAAHAAPPATLLVPALQQAHRITDLADFLAAVHAPGRPIAHHHTGLRPGDKLHEALIASEERTAPSAIPGLLAVQTSSVSPDFPGLLLALAQAIQDRDLPRAIEVVTALVPSYQSSDVVQSLVAASRLARSGAGATR